MADRIACDSDFAEIRDLGKSTVDRTTVAMGRLGGFLGFWGWELQRGIDSALEKWRYT